MKIITTTLAAGLLFSTAEEFTRASDFALGADLFFLKWPAQTIPVADFFTDFGTQRTGPNFGCPPAIFCTADAGSLSAFVIKPHTGQPVPMPYPFCERFMPAR